VSRKSLQVLAMLKILEKAHAELTLWNTLVPSVNLRGNKKYMDTLIVKVKGGDGGRGAISFLREKSRSVGPPSGGDGGKGGDVVFIASSEISSLCDLRRICCAGSGARGGSKCKNGASGASLEVHVPIGTLVRTWNKEQNMAGRVIADLAENGARHIIAFGGIGGRGNKNFATPVQRSPRFCEDGQVGQEKTVSLELKTIADIGLVGFPNAGKSTLLSVITNAVPKIASWPFTTRTPYVGMLETGDMRMGPVSIADLPGLVAGAHQNVGLGHEFLRHVERTRVLCYVLDMGPGNTGEQRGISGGFGDPFRDYQTLRRELELYDRRLLQKPALLVANKMDAEHAVENLARLRRQLKDRSLPILPISALYQKNLQALKDCLKKMLAF